MSEQQQQSEVGFVDAWNLGRSLDNLRAFVSSRYAVSTQLPPPAVRSAESRHSEQVTGGLPVSFQLQLLTGAYLVFDQQLWPVLSSVRIFFATYALPPGSSAGDKVGPGVYMFVQGDPPVSCSAEVEVRPRDGRWPSVPVFRIAGADRESADPVLLTLKAWLDGELGEASTTEEVEERYHDQVLHPEMEAALGLHDSSQEETQNQQK